MLGESTTGFSERRIATTERRSAFAVRALILFFVLEYVRPPLLAQLQLQALIIVVMLALWLAARDRPWANILTAQVLFFCICLQGILSSYNNYAAYAISRAMFGHVVIALALSWMLAVRQIFTTVTWAWLMIIGYVAVYGLTHGGKGPGAMLGDENDLALACATAFPFAFYSFERLTGWRRWLSGGIGGLLVLAIVVSFSRGGLVALAAAGIYCWLASRHKVRGLVTGVVALLLLLIAAPEQGRTGQSYGERLSSIFQTDEGTAETRRFLWSAARNMWQANPILGVGAGNFSFVVGRYQPQDFEKPDYLERDWSGTAVHSVYFQVLAEHGSVGIALLGYLLWAHFRAIRRLRRAASRPELPSDLRRDAELYGGALGGAVIGYGAAGAFLSVAYYPYLWYFTAMAVALEAAVQREVTAAGAKRA